MKKSLTLDGMTISHSLFILCTLGMLGLSLYMTVHYFQTLFPTTLNTKTMLCDFSSIWSCQTATFSKISNIAGVPIAAFGMLISGIFFMGSLFPSEEKEKTNAFIALINLVGCIFLFLYSILVHHSLCPYCTGYHLLSLGAFLLIFFYSDSVTKPSIKNLSLYLIPFILLTSFLGWYYHQESGKQKILAESLIKQYDSLPKDGDPTTPSPFRLAKATEDFSQAPIRLSIFSDFQCPFCRILASQVSKFIEQYKGKINIQYYFWPLDQACNEHVKNLIHPLACKASVLAACAGEKFDKVHDLIFENQEKLSEEFLQNTAKNFSLQTCYESQQTKPLVVEHIKVGDQYHVESTPILILNGVKIMGTIPTAQMYILMDHLLKK